MNRERGTPRVRASGASGDTAHRLSPAARPTPSRARVREALFAAGGVPGAGRLATHPSAPIATPFGTAEPVEHRRVRAMAVSPAAPPPNVGFLDGIQRFALEGHFDLAPVVRAYVAAAVLTRECDGLKTAAEEQEECFVAPLARLSVPRRKALEALGLPVHDCRGEGRAHPLVDAQRAVEEVERRRERLECTVADGFATANPDAWLVVDGAIRPGSPSHRVIGVVKSHETQFLDGSDLEAALTLPHDCRSSVFAKASTHGGKVYTWYLRLWPWDGEDLLHGLVRIERCAHQHTVEEADAVSGWLLSERSPLSAPDGRWDRLLYPIHLVESYLRARAGGWT